VSSVTPWPDVGQVYGLLVALEAGVGCVGGVVVSVAVSNCLDIDIPIVRGNLVVARGSTGSRVVQVKHLGFGEFHYERAKVLALVNPVVTNLRVLALEHHLFEALGANAYPVALHLGPVGTDDFKEPVGRNLEPMGVFGLGVHVNTEEDYFSVFGLLTNELVHVYSSHYKLFLVALYRD
jgi:hypothetical protein